MSSCPIVRSEGGDGDEMDVGSLEQFNCFQDQWTQAANWTHLFELQQEDDSRRRTADVHLICVNGCVPVHTPLIAHFSPFMKELLESQGSNWIGIRTVILPDLEVQDVKRLVNLLYTGSSVIGGLNDLAKVVQVCQLLGIVGLDQALRVDLPEKDEHPEDVRHYLYPSPSGGGGELDEWGHEATKSEDLLSFINRRDEIEEEMEEEEEESLADDEEEEVEAEGKESDHDNSEDENPGAGIVDEQEETGGESQEELDDPEEPPESKEPEQSEDEFFDVENTQSAGDENSDTEVQGRNQEIEDEVAPTPETESPETLGDVGDDTDVAESECAEKPESAADRVESLPDSDSDDSDCQIIEVKPKSKSPKKTRIQTRARTIRFDEEEEAEHFNPANWKFCIKTEKKEVEVSSSRPEPEEEPEPTPGPSPYALRDRSKLRPDPRSESTDTERLSSTPSTTNSTSHCTTNTFSGEEKSGTESETMESEGESVEPNPKRSLRSNRPRVNYRELEGGPTVQPGYRDDSDWDQDSEGPSPPKRKRLRSSYANGSSPVVQKDALTLTPREIWDAGDIENRLSTCQLCEKKFPSAGQAAACIQKHGRIRCYFCFGLCKGQSDLYAHYLAKHNPPLKLKDYQPLKKESISCELCGDVVSFFGVSLHLITKHMNKSPVQPAPPTGTSQSPPESNSTSPSKAKILNFD